MPAYLAGKEERFLEELLVVVFAEVEVGGRRGVEVQDVICGMEF